MSLARALLAFAPPTITYVGNYESNANATAYTSSSFTIPDGLSALVVYAETALSGTTTAAKLGDSGGTAMTAAVELGANQFYVGIFYLATASASNTFYVSFNKTQQRCRMELYSLQNLSSTTPVSTDSAEVSVDTTISCTLGTSALDAVALAAVCHMDGGINTTWTAPFVRATNFTAIATEGTSGSAATASGLSTGSVAVQADFDAEISTSRIVAALWR